MPVLARWLESAPPDALALIAEEGALSYDQLRGKADCLASWLGEQGVAHGAMLAALSASPLRLAILAWSLSRLGATLLPLNPDWPAARLSALLDQAGVDWIVADEELATPQAWKALSGRQAQEIWSACCQPGKSVPPSPEAGNPIELLISTSGSAGEPKCVMLSDANLEAAVLAARSRMPLSVGDVWLNCLPLYHVGGMSILYRCAQAGATMLLQRFDAVRVMQALQRHRITHISLVPAMLAQLIEAGPPAPGLKYALIGGGPLSASLAQRAMELGWPLCPSYGLSEAASQVATLCCMSSQWQQGMAGTPLPGMEVEIAGAQSRSAPGRIRLRGPMVMAGYANPGRESGHGLQDGWFVTGDRGYLDADGKLVVLGREDDVLVSGGANVHPAEAEALLLACPGIADVALTALPDEIWGQRLAALVVGSASVDAVQEWCRANMPGFMRPRLIVPVPALPRNALGKLERNRLPELVCATTSREN